MFARRLFDPHASRFDLLGIAPRGPNAFAAYWRLEGVLQLPWRPSIKPFTGATLYELSPEGLISSHTEAWSISALDAFASAIFPSVGAAAAPSHEELRAAFAETFDETAELSIAAAAPSCPLQRLAAFGKQLERELGSMRAQLSSGGVAHWIGSHRDNSVAPPLWPEPPVPRLPGDGMRAHSQLQEERNLSA